MDKKVNETAEENQISSAREVEEVLKTSSRRLMIIFSSTFVIIILGIFFFIPYLRNLSVINVLISIASGIIGFSVFLLFDRKKKRSNYEEKR